MPYSFDLAQTQLGTETVWGTGVTGTVKLGLVEECTLTPEIENKVIEEDQRGSLAPGFVDVFMSHKGKGALSGILTYEDAPYLLDSAFGQATPSGVGPYVYAHGGAHSSVPARRKLSVIHGQAGLVHRLTGGLVQKLNISGESGGEVKYSADLIGKKVEPATLAALSDRPLTPVLCQHGSIYIDADDGTIGTTLISTTWFDFELNLETNVETFMGIGSVYPSNYREAKNKGSLKLSLEADATSQGYLSSMLAANLKKQVRMKFTSGTNIAQFDFSGMFKGAPEMYQEKDKVVAFEFEMDAINNSTLANWFASSITNSVSALV